jgi:RimJ/RimL family protein N-acetyltransferase
LTLTQYPRVVYTLSDSQPSVWRSQLPPGYAIRPIDQTLLNDATLGNHTDLIEEIEQCWPSQAQFLGYGFGVCLVGQHEIICRCTAEYVSPGKCGIGIATAEPYRRQGFATLTAGTFIDECLTRTITPYWDAWLRNTASVATAEKIGLHKIQEYQVYLGAMV